MIGGKTFNKFYPFYPVDPPGGWKWLRWLFRRGERGMLLLNMAPGDEIAQMCTYRDWLVVISRRGELYFISGDRFASPHEVMDLTVHKK